MTDRLLSVRHRLAVLERLGTLAAEINDISTWLSGLDGSGVDAAAVKAEGAADLLAGAAWILETPLRPAWQAVPQHWDGQPANGYGHRPY